MAAMVKGGNDTERAANMDTFAAGISRGLTRRRAVLL